MKPRFAVWNVAAKIFWWLDRPEGFATKAEAAAEIKRLNYGLKFPYSLVVKKLPPGKGIAQNPKSKRSDLPLVCPSTSFLR